MHQFRNILVGVDASSGDRLASDEIGGATAEAVRRAVWLGQQLNGQVTFLAALDLSAHTEELLKQTGATTAGSVETAAQHAVDQLAQSAQAQGVPAKGLVAHGKPWEAITRQVLRENHDLVLVGNRRRNAASRFLFGGTSSKLARFCPCPVWVTKHDPKFDDIHMLVACDLGPDMERILHLAVGGGRLLDARVHVLHSVEFGVDQGMWHAGLAHQEVAQFREKAKDAALSQIRQVLAHTDFRTLRAGVQVHVVEGDPDDAILKAISEFGIDLLVMGTKARTGLPGLFVGNTAERLMSQADCSLLIIKPEGFVCPISAE